MRISGDVAGRFEAFHERRQWPQMLVSIGLAVLALWLLLVALPLPNANAEKGVRAFYGGEGTKGGQFTRGNANDPALNGIAINQAGSGGVGAGDVYVVDGGNNRVQQFTEAGEFIRAFGLDVGGPGVNICTVAASCQAAKAAGQAGGMANPQGIAIDQANGNLYVSDYGNRRIDVFSATGVFLGAFGWQVNANAPAATLQYCTAATGCQAGSDGSGAGQFSQNQNGVEIGGVAVRPTDGHVLVASPANRRIDEFAPVLLGNVVTGVEFVRGFGWGAATGADEYQICTITCHAPGSPEGAGLGQFGREQPWQLTLDGSGTVFVPDSGGFFQTPRARVMTFGPTGQPLGVFAEGAFLARSGRRDIYGIAADAGDGRVLVARGIEELAEFGPAGELLETYLQGTGLLLSRSFLAVNEAADLIYVTAPGNAGFVVLGEIVPPTATIDPVTQFAQDPAGVSATFKGQVNPKALETGYHFEYSRDGVNWTRIPTTDLFLPADDVDHQVEPQTAAGLEGLTEYRVRLVATKIFNAGSATAETTFQTPSIPPVVSAPSGTEVSDTAAVLRALVNPENQTTKYHFECVTEAQFAESGFASAFRVPGGEEPTVDGGQALEVSQRVEGLTPVTTYQCRVVAENATGQTVGAKGTFTTFQPAVGGLPDDRVYEQASPVDKNGNNVLGEPNAVQASRDGDAITFFSPGGIPGGEGAQEPPVYMAQRAADGSGWTTQGLLPPAASGPLGKVLGWDESLLSAYVRNANPGEDFHYYRRDSSDRQLTSIATNESSEVFHYAASSGDGRVVFFEFSGAPLAPGAMAGIPTAYSWDQATRQIHLVGVLNNGQVPSEGTFAGPYAWFQGAKGITTEGGAANLYYTEPWHALSQDGSAAFFTARGSGQLYMRKSPLAPQSSVNAQDECTEPGKACTLRISASQKTNGDGPGGTDPAGPRPAAFAGATPNASTVLLMSSEELTNDANTGSAGIARSNLDGTAIEESFIPSTASAVAVGSSHVYWVNPGTGSIGRAALDGTGIDPKFITGASNPQGVAVDGSHVYWTNAGTGAEKAGTIGRALLDGTEVNQSFINGATNPQGIAVSGSFIFWANSGATEGTRKIGRANLNGTGAIQTFITAGGNSGAFGLAVSEPYVFWTNPALSSVGRATTAGAEIKPQLVSTGPEPRGIAAGATGIYWVNGGAGTIARAGVNGEGAEAALVKGRSRPRGIAVDAAHLYWTEDRSGEGNDLYRFDTASGKLTDLSPDASYPTGAEVKGVVGMSGDGSYVYFVAAGALAPGASRQSCAGSGEVVRGLCNLYLWHGGDTTYVATLEAGVNGEPGNGGATNNARGDMFNWIPTSVWGGNNLTENTARVSDDGTLLFRSNRPLTGYPNVGPCDIGPGGVASQGVCPEFFRYEPGPTPKLICVSCSPTGAPPAGAAALQKFQESLIKPRVPSSTLTRNLSADGSKIFFTTADKLVATDTNGVDDVYEWEANGSGTCRSEAQNGGCLSLISSGTSPQPSYFADASVSGSDAFFFTAQPLVGQDRDGLVDVYDAREHGGIAAQNPPQERICTDDQSCKPAAVPPPGVASPAAPSGEGNVKPPPPKCRKGFKRVKRHGKPICVRIRKKHNKQKGHKNQRQHRKHESGNRRGMGVSR